ncbi:HEAT repeat-containing protein 1 isoform X3 [Cyclopterus lumpus]|uniref:HEAT repeat-containing protein 1 isoform X3 n=1 Tax=Cyclopterus lumpus TaxID=8103 RepID=UPI0014861AE5|nr:HEAT repeat-containing protein 1 isoform X3 [Cyclopterus lumpus]
MTSLAHQLRRLALPQSDPNLLTRSEVASLLFDPKDAVSMDRSTFYALGCTGLEELMGIEPAFLEFQDTLFSRASLTLERSVQSKEVNEKLDAGISLFLARLSPYFLLKPAHKCLEWLVHRFHVQLYNADALLRCSLPFHDTNVFVRVLQLLHIRDAAARWGWLLGPQKAGVPLSRGALVAHCYSDLSFMDFICSLVTGSVQAYSGRSGSCSQLRVIFSFYASTIVSALGAVEKVSDAIISKLLPFVHKGLKSSLTDYKAATLMIVCQLAVKVTMEASLVDILAAHVAKSLLGEPVLAKEGLGCLVVLLQNQKEGSAGPRASVSLSSVPALASTLQAMAAAHDVAPLLRYLLPHLIHAAFTCRSGETQKDQLAVLEAVLKSVPLTNGLDRTVARWILDGYLRQTELSADDSSAFDRRLLPLVRLFESRYCAALDGVLAGHVTADGEKRLYHQFLSLSVSSGKHQMLGDSDTSLLLSLKHPQPSVRVSALEHLVGVIASAQQSLDKTFLKDAVMERLKDDVPEVVSAALKVLEVLLDVLDPDDVVLSLLSLLHRADLSVAESWLPVLTEAVRLLSDPRLGKGDAELLQKAGWRLLPLLVITSSAELRFASCVARCSVVCRHPLTQNWAQELEEVMKRSSEPDFLGLANERLVSTLTKNLTSMELFSRRDALEQLALSVERQRGPGLRARASFPVLTQTLLLGLGGLSETQHLLTAQRVYALLEAPLMEVIGAAAAQEDGRCVSDAPSSFSGALTLYLSRCGQQPGERLDREFSFVLIALLRDFICSLRCHDASFKGDVWWNPEKLDTNTCCYLGLTCRLFSVIIRGAGEGPASGSFRDLMKLLIKVHLCEPPMLFRFLCVLWGYGSNHGDQLDVKVGAVLQTRALYVGGAVLSAQPSTMLEQLAAADSPVVPSLLCCLTSPVREVRRAALGTLSSLSGAGASPFRPITERLLKNSEEIIADPSYLSQALGVLQEESVKAKRLRSSLQQLLQSAGTPGCPSYSACSLLRALSHANGPAVLSELLPVLDRLLEQSGPDTPSLLRSEAQLMHLVLGKYNEASAPLLAENQNCLDLFVRALRNSTQPHPDIPSCQIIALEQMTKPFFSALGGEAVQQKLLSAMLDVLLESRSPLVTDTVRSVFKGMAVDGQLVANELAPPEKPKVSVTVQQSRRSRMSQRKPVEAGDGGPAGGAVSWQRVTLILELLQHKKKLKRAQTLVPVLFALLARRGDSEANANRAPCSRSLDPCPADHTNMEYTKQLLLGCLLNVCHRLSPAGGAVGPDLLDEDKFSVELVVQCIRASDVPQTHHHALLLLGAAAAIFPEKVLLNIMPIFTFMGANIMRLDDAYSFRVIDQTVQMVIPALIQVRETGTSTGWRRGPPPGGDGDLHRVETGYLLETGYLHRVETGYLLETGYLHRVETGYLLETGTSTGWRRGTSWRRGPPPGGDGVPPGDGDLHRVETGTSTGWRRGTSTGWRRGTSWRRGPPPGGDGDLHRVETGYLLETGTSTGWRRGTSWRRGPPPGGDGDLHQLETGPSPSPLSPPPPQAHQLSDGTSSSHVVAVVTRILHVFADALPHVPDHRRLPILSQLVTTLGPARFLWVLMLLLFKLHATQTATSTSEKDAALERDVDFWVSLCCEFKVSEQLSSLISILLFLLKLPDDKHDAPVTRRPEPKKEVEEEVEELIFSLEAHSSKELRHFQFLSVSFMAQLLGSAGFIGKVADGADAVDESLQQRLLEEILRYIHAVARRAEDNADKPTAKFWRVLLNKAYEVLDKVNSLLPTDTFITVMRGLMGNELASVRRKAMELLNNKLQHRTQWEDRQVTVLLQLTGDLLSIVGKSSGEVMEREAEHAINRQTALYSLKLLCRSFGSAHQEAFVPVLQRAVDIAAAPEEEKNVTGSALLCIAEVVGALKALAIPHLPRLMPAVLNTLTDRKELLTNEIYLLSAVTALQRVTETLPHFISPYLQDTTSQVCRLTRLLESSSSSSSAATQLSTRLASLRSTLATRLPPRVLLPTVTRCYGSMVVDRKRQLGALMSILKEHITHMEKDQLSFHQSELTSFFLCALDFRAEHCQGDLQKTSEVEGHVIDCLLSMVMKLSEVTFRPLFFKLLDWSKLGRERLLTFCRLSDVFADRLKGLFVLFAGNLVTGFVDLLRQTNGSKTDESLFDSKVKTNQLLRFVLDCLFKIFMFDTQKFVSRERGDALMSPLVDQLENTVGGDQVYQQLVTQHLVPCVGQFSVALADESQWKTLNYQILLKTRHPDSKVRFSSLLMLMELASKLKENYMVLLPETIPFLAELMEDDCEEVEQQVQKVVQEMEKILGEPLQSYF